MPTEQVFTFFSNAVPKDTFVVVHFEGVEGISRLYEFDITLISENSDIDLEKVLDSPAALRIETEDDEPITYSGILSEFEQRQSVEQYTVFRATLVPKLWWATQSVQNQVFLNRTTPQIMETVLQQSGLTNLDYEFRLQGNYGKPWEMICQFRESHYNFISRWMEWEGIYYFFESRESGEKLVITDSSQGDGSNSGELNLKYVDTFGLNIEPLEDIVTSWTCRQKRLPRNVMLKDYNYRHPDLDISGQADITDNGVGDVYLYGEHAQSPEEADRLARVRAGEHICRQKQFFGQSRSPRIRSGGFFGLSDHGREDFNRGYLIVEVNHRGRQTGFGLDGLREELAELEKQPVYANDLKAIPSGVGYRPRRLARIPRFYGTLNGRIDAAGSGQYAELDEQGRYKVILPFDLSGRRDGKASAWIRMAQPYAGSDHGLHFPLHKGTEVLLTFIDGNPDRPIISASVPNPDTASPVNSSSQTMARITTGGQNKLHFEDKTRAQSIFMQAPTANSWIRVGAPNDPEPPSSQDDPKTGEGIKISTNGNLMEDVEGDKQIDLEGDYTSDVAGNYSLTVARKYTEVVGAGSDLMKQITVNGNKGQLITGSDKLKVSGGQNIEVAGHQKVKAGSRNLEVTGNLDETVNGALTTTVEGATNITYNSDTVITYNGARYENNESSDIWNSGENAELFGGGSFEMFLGGQFGLNIGAFLEIMLGYSVGVAAGISIEIFGGGKVEMNKGYKIEMDGMTDVSVKVAGFKAWKKPIAVLCGGLFFG